MKKLIFTLLLLSNFLFAQHITFVYELKLRSNPDKDSLTTETYYLDVSGSQSVFRSQQARISDSLKYSKGYGGVEKVTFNQLYAIKDRERKEVIKSITTPLMNDLYFIRIEDQANWRILNEITKIDNIDCQKATRNYAGREWTAWFDKNTLIQDGPYIFHGLPGLIIKLYDEKGDYDFSLMEIKNSTVNKTFHLRKGKEINWETYSRLQNNYYSDPFSEIKNRGLKYKVGDQNGNPVDMNLRQMTENIRKKMTENNNPLELNQKIEYK